MENLLFLGVPILKHIRVLMVVFKFSHLDVRNAQVSCFGIFSAEKRTVDKYCSP